MLIGNFKCTFYYVQNLLGREVAEYGKSTLSW